MNGGIANHGKAVRSRGHEDQYAIALAGFVHSQLDKMSLRCRHCIRGGFPGNKYSYLSGGPLLRITNCLNNFLVTKLVKKFPGLHSRLPTSSRAAPSETAAA